MTDKYISPEHVIRNLLTERSVDTDKFQGTANAFFKSVTIQTKKDGEHIAATGPVRVARIVAGQRTSETENMGEEIIDVNEKYVGDQQSLKPTVKQKSDLVDTIKNIPGAADAAARGFAGSATFGGANYVAAAGDYALKNLGSMVGIGKGTTFDKELKQEYEKDEKAKKEHPTAFTAGEWAPLALGGAKAGVSVAKGAYNLAKSAPEAVKAVGSALTTPVSTTAKVATAVAKDITKPIGSAAVNLAKGNVKQAGKDVVKYGKEIPSTVSGLTKFGAGLEGGLQGLEAIGDKEKRKQMFSPGGGTKFAQDVGKAGVELAAPGSVEAVKKASEGKWKEAGKETARAVTGAAVVNPSLSRFVYDAAAGYFKPNISLTGEGGASDKLYDKAIKQKKLKENAAIVKKVKNEKLNEQSKAVKTLEALPRGEKAIENIWKLFQGGEEGAKAVEGAAKGKPARKQPSPGKTEPGREGKPYVDKPANQPGGPNVTPFKAPDYVPPYRPDTTPKFPGVPANPAPGAPKVTPKRVRPDEFPPPANPPKVEPPKEKPPVKTPKEKPQRPPDQNPFPDKPAEVKPKAPPIELPKKLEPPPYTSPKQPAPAVRPEVPGALPAARPAAAPEVAPAGRPAPNPFKKTETVKKPEEIKKTETKPPKREEGKPPKGKPKFPFWLPGITPGQSITTGSISGFGVPDILHRSGEPREYSPWTMKVEETRYDIENVARPKTPRNKATKQAEIIRKIIEEKKTSKKNATVVDTKPKLNTPEPGTN